MMNDYDAADGGGCWITFGGHLRGEIRGDSRGSPARGWVVPQMWPTATLTNLYQVPDRATGGHSAGNWSSAHR